MHPCQFPLALVERLIFSLSDVNDYVFDPFMGVGTSGAAALINGRKFIGCELDKIYYDLAVARCKEATVGTFNYRPSDKPVLIPDENMAVARKPSSFLF